MDKEDHDLLIEVNTIVKELDRKIGNLVNSVETMKDRCTDHEVRLTQNESDTSGLCRKVSSHLDAHNRSVARTIAIVGIVAGVVATIVTALITMAH